MRLILQALLPPSLEAPSYGVDFFSLMQTTAPALIPSRFDVVEPIRKAFDLELLAEFASEYWKERFFWVSNKSKTQGYWSTSHGCAKTRHCRLSIEDKTGKTNPDLFVTFLRALSQRWPIELGFVHMCSSIEFDHSVPDNYTAYSGLDGNTATAQAKDWIPNLGWITIFGDPYLKMIGADKIKSSPAYRIEEWGKGGTAVQLTPSPMDAVDDYAAFDKTRQAVKQHLGLEYFYTPGSKPGSKKTPVFESLLEYAKSKPCS